MADLQRHPPLRFDPHNKWFQRQLAIVDEGLRLADGRFLVGMPDLVENIDILAAMRAPQTLLLDLVDAAPLVEERLRQINTVYVAAFDALYERIKDDAGGCAYGPFSIWGPGETAKVQCDASAMLSPKMFRRFVVPALTEQCRWLDYSMFHLDGEDALCHVDALLQIEPLDAIQWTPVFGYGAEGGGKPKWHDLYRRILAAGKSVQAVAVKCDEVLPMLDAVGPAGMYIATAAPNETAARQLIDQVEAYR